ncbi:MAG: GDP-mannose 4,6-dehydratase, partial [Anaerolineae bacterium]
MRSLLIAGGAGFIGSHFARRVLDRYEGYRVTVFDRLTYAGHRQTLADLDSNPDFDFVRGDITDRSEVEGAVRKHNVDTLVNFAAHTHVDRSILEPGSFIQTDVFGVHVLLELTR